MTALLSADTLAAIRNEGEQGFPQEICGFLLGRVTDGNREVTRHRAVDNARAEGEQRNRYIIRPEDFLATEKLARAEQLDIIGFYHSHPNAPARPSVYDTEHAWPWYVYVIVSVLDGRAGDVTAWVLQDDRREFGPEALVTND